MQHGATISLYALLHCHACLRKLYVTIHVQRNFLNFYGQWQNTFLILTVYRAIFHNQNTKGVRLHKIKFVSETWAGLLESQGSNPERWGCEGRLKSISLPPSIDRQQPHDPPVWPPSAGRSTHQCPANSILHRGRLGHGIPEYKKRNVPVSLL